MTASNTNDNTKRSLCKTCKNRFRMVCIPSNMQKFLDVSDESFLALNGEEDVVIITMCLVADVDLDLNTVVDCSHYDPIDEKTSIFKHKIE